MNTDHEDTRPLRDPVPSDTRPTPTWPAPQGNPVGYPAAPPPARPPRRRGLGAGVLALALLLGLGGGVAGAAGYDALFDEGTPAGGNAGGLGAVQTVDKPPLEVDNGSVPAVAEKLLPSTVQVLADINGEQLGATGSGFVLDEEGHIVTNNHVVEGADDGRIIVVDNKGKRHEADIVGRSPVYDLAVLQVDGLDAEPAAIGTSEDLRIGENVVAIGSPLGLSSTVTSGIVSALHRPVTTTGEDANANSYIDAVQTDAAINPGNSGGPLVDMTGRVVGVNSAIASTGGMTGDTGNIGVGFAIPIEQVRITADQILRSGEAQYPVIGAEVRSVGRGEGSRIEKIEAGSPAAESGLEQGDVVVKVEDRLVTDSPSLIVALRTHQPGETVELTVERDGDQEKVEVTLGSKVG